MGFRSSFLQWALAILLVASSAPETAEAFDANKCDAFVFRTVENALWHCGKPIPSDTDDGLYCDHSQGYPNVWPFAWKSDHPDDWCHFMVATVRAGVTGSPETEDHYPLTPEVDLSKTPGPNIYFWSTIVDWGCYILDDAKEKVVEAYLVDSQKGKHASTTNIQCQRTQNYFNYWVLHSAIRDLKWWGEIPTITYNPIKQGTWGRCHYDNAGVSPNYETELSVEYAECLAGFVCEYKFQGYAGCYPDPKFDHECCISWNNKCEKQGDCCYGSECNAQGFCEVGLTPLYEDPPGICESRATKTDRKIWTRCFNYTEGTEDDCAPGYKCEGTSFYAQCEVDPTVKNDCCIWNWDTSSPRPGDCCLGWMAHCHQTDPITGACLVSQCIPGRETGVDEWGNSMLDVHDRLCKDTPPLASWNENIHTCFGSVCGLWGDPHIITCDNLHYDCQAVGLFTVMKNHMFHIQANFVFIETAWGGASITNDLVIDYVKDTASLPTMQLSFPDFDKIDKDNQVYDPRTRYIGACPTMLYIDGVMVDISKVPNNGYLYGDATSDFSMKLSQTWNQIDIKHFAGYDASTGLKYYSESIIWIEGGGPFSDWSCIISYFICLPNQDKTKFEEYSVGLLGTPTENTRDDWMTKDGQTLSIPKENRTVAAFHYCMDNWCVGQDESIMTYEEGLTYADYMCTSQVFYPFNPDKCENKDEIIELCKNAAQVVHCQMEKCAGNTQTDVDEQIIKNITTLTTDPEDNIPEFPNVNETNYGDCANLGAGLSGATGVGAYTLTYPKIQSSLAGTFTHGIDNSVSLLVGGTFNCKSGTGFEGRAVFLGDMTLETTGCSKLVATPFGSLIHPAEQSTCIEVGGEVSISSNFDNNKYIMNEYGNTVKGCHLMYKGGCKINGGACPNNITKLNEQFIHTTGDFKHDAALNLTLWQTELTRLSQKTAFWKTLPGNGVVETSNGVMTFKAGPDSNPVQIFRLRLPLDDSIVSVVFNKELISKTILIVVNGAGNFNVPTFCYHPTDANPGDAPICGRDTFPPSLVSSTAWVFPTRGTIKMKGLAEFQGSIVIPNGDLIFKASGHSGRMLVGGDVTLNGVATELHNYEFDPTSKPLPLSSDLGEVCNIQPPAACNDTIKPLTSTTACPSKPDGIVKLIKSTGGAALPAGEPVLYDIIIEDPLDLASAKTVKFKVDSPFTNYTDIYVKHVQKVGKYAMDPVCESMPFTYGCNYEAPTIEVGCHEYEGVDPFALVTLYFASNTDSDVMAFGNGVAVDKCCKPPAEYASGYGIVEYTFEIQCACPTSVATA